MFISSKTNDGSTIDQLKDIINQGLETLRSENIKALASAKSALEAVDLPKIEKIELANPFIYGGSDSLWNVVTGELTKNKGGYNETKPTPDMVQSECLKRIEGMKVIADTTHISNIAKLESNKRLIQKLSFIMKEIGMPDSYKEGTGKWKKATRYSYSQSEVMETKSAGWIQDIARNVTTNDGHEQCQDSYERWKKSIAERTEKTKEDARIAQMKLDEASKGSAEQQRKLQEALAEAARLKEELTKANQILGA